MQKVKANQPAKEFLVRHSWASSAPWHGSDVYLQLEMYIGVPTIEEECDDFCCYFESPNRRSLSSMDHEDRCWHRTRAERARIRSRVTSSADSRSSNSLKGAAKPSK